jgi:hypothetical protein
LGSKRDKAMSLTQSLEDQEKLERIEESLKKYTSYYQQLSN